ncbi:MAG: hypothetical protein AUI60_01310 [Thaumarchaeota archaeon 13_1_40CM_2_39_4]|nr:MAG: hypothetical protein AUI60_01310 [Thaumarchaeota archaeon 13_1_40CM_2_39_4]OLE39338.1 MAG: hypothetical protein AUF74_02095 [Thaumarchaeota archaeon 13_1_20CM_2_38_5]
MVLLNYIGAGQADEIAGNFIRPSFRIFNITNITYRTGVWFVKVDILSFGTRRVQTLAIEAETGRIISCE